MKTAKLHLFLLPIALIAFHFTYGAVNFIGLSSDHAMHVLMSENFSFPQDLYYWGQDRLGSIIPMLGWVFHLFGFSPIVAATLAQMTLLAASYLLLSSILKTTWSRILLLLLVFFPAGLFDIQVMIGHPYIGQLFFLSLLIWLIIKQGENHKVIWTFGPIICALGVWCNELFVATIPFLLILWKPDLRGLKKHHREPFVISCTLAGLFLLIAKKYAFRVPGYSSSIFASPQEILQGITLLFERLYKNWTLHTYEPFGSLSLTLGTILVIIVLIRLSKKQYVPLAIYFLGSALLTLGLILLSRWAVQMDYPMRYYISVVMLAWLGLLFAFDAAKKDLLPKIILSAALILVATSGFYRMKYWGYLVNNRITVHQARELATTENIGIIGNYWNTYLIEAINPEEIDATPHDKDLLRNQNSLKSIFGRDSIMVLDLGFLDTFPDTLFQFGAVLYKTSDAIKDRETKHAFYKVISQFKEYYLPEELKISGGIAEGGSVVFTSNNYIHTEHAVEGPLCTLPLGNYQVCFEVEIMEAWKGKAPKIDVTSHMGRKLISNASLSLSDTTHCLNFHINQPLPTINFRLHYFGSGKIEFRGIKVEKLN